MTAHYQRGRKDLIYTELRVRHGLRRMTKSIISPAASVKVRPRDSCTALAHAPAAEPGDSAHAQKSNVNCFPNTKVCSPAEKPTAPVPLESQDWGHCGCISYNAFALRRHPCQISVGKDEG